MTSALHSNLKKVLLCVLLLSALVIGIPACADGVEAVATLSPASLAAPGEVTASIRVTNSAESDMVSPVVLYDPAGKVFSGFGDGGSALLKAGEFATVQGKISVSREQLEAGKVVFTLRSKDENGKETKQDIIAGIEYTGEKVELQANRTLSPEVVRQGATASVVYELYNAGTVELTGIKLVDKIASKSPQTLSSLKPGDKKTLTVTAKMGSKDLTSSAKITYKAKGDSKTRELSLDEMTVPVAVKGLEVTLSADRTACDIGDTVVLTMSVNNKGNITYTDVSVTDKALGTVFEGLTIPASSAFTKEKEVTVLAPTSYSFTLRLTDNTGMTNSLTTDAVPVSAYDPEKELKLTVLLTCDDDTIKTMPADVSMQLVVSNVSSVDCEKVTLTHGDTKIYTIPALKAGESARIKRDYTVSQSGQFRFTATTKDTIGNTVSFDSNTLQLSYVAPTAVPTAVPVVTPAPLVTLPPATFEDAGSGARTTRNVLYTLTIVLAIAFAVCLILYLAGAVVRGTKHHQSGRAYDHLDLGEKRDYTEPAEEKEHQEAPQDTPEMPHEKLLRDNDVQEAAVEDDEPNFDIPDPVPEDQLIRPDAPAEDVQAPETAPEESHAPETATVDSHAPEQMPQTDGVGGYRITRETAPDETPQRKRRAARKPVDTDDEEE